MPDNAAGLAVGWSRLVVSVDSMSVSIKMQCHVLGMLTAQGVFYTRNERPAVIVLPLLSQIQDLPLAARKVAALTFLSNIFGTFSVDYFIDRLFVDASTYCRNISTRTGLQLSSGTRCTTKGNTHIGHLMTGFEKLIHIGFGDIHLVLQAPVHRQRLSHQGGLDADMAGFID